MSYVSTRSQSGRDKSADTPTATKVQINILDNEQQDTGISELRQNASLTHDEKLDYLCKKVDEIAETVKSLKKENEHKDKKIKVLEQRIESLEQYTRRDDIVIAGFHPAPPPLSAS